MSNQGSLPINEVICGDCLKDMTALPDACIDLCYLDPPFNTGQRQRAQHGSFGDSFADGGDYIAFLAPRIEQIHRVLKPTGSILLHCDWRTSHRVRIVLDDIFGEHNFVNHIIWRYGLGGSSPRRFARKHDDILYYGKSNDYSFEPPMVPATSNRMKGQFKKADDVLDVPAINNMALERVGYPTQKPLALLDVLIRACCPQDGIVLDPFCGSGTTLVAAQRLGRSYLGMDINPQAIEIAKRRIQTSSNSEVRQAQAVG